MLSALIGAAETYRPPHYAPRHVLCRHNKEGSDDRNDPFGGV
jgi:hypothetical protein